MGGSNKWGRMHVSVIDGLEKEAKLTPKAKTLKMFHFVSFCNDFLHVPVGHGPVSDFQMN
eukprot:291873-Amphidinium_carterae.1